MGKQTTLILQQCGWPSGCHRLATIGVYTSGGNIDLPLAVSCGQHKPKRAPWGLRFIKLNLKLPRQTIIQRITQ